LKDAPDSKSRRSKSSRPSRQQIHPALRQDTYRRLSTYSARRSVSLTAVVEAALRQYLDDASDVALLMRRLDRATRRIDRVRRELALLSEFVSVWARLWFAHTPQLPDEARAAAQTSAAKRYGQLLDFVSKRVAGGQRLAIDLLGQDVGDDDDPPTPTRGEADGPRE
jgi:hypothetical protein